MRPAIRIESGAKSALDPHRPVTIQPYIAADLPTLDLSVREVTAIEPARTLWDKLVIAHGVRRWYERRGVVRQEGQRISRHYYDLHCLYHSPFGKEAIQDHQLAADCVSHARMFFDRPDFDWASAMPGSYAIMPVSGMTEALRKDYERMQAMIFGDVPTFEEVMHTIEELDKAANQK